MYAVLETGGKQYRVKEGDVINVEKINAEIGSEVVLDKVLLVKKDENLKVGTPYLDAKVICEVLDQFKGEKIIVFKYKRRKGYRRKKGHRQLYTKLKVKTIELS